MYSKIERAIAHVTEARDNYIEACQALKLAREDFAVDPFAESISYALTNAELDQKVAGLFYRNVVTSSHASGEPINDFKDANKTLAAARRNYMAARTALKLARTFQDEDPRNQRITAAAGEDFEEAVCLYAAATLALKAKVR